MDKKEIEADYAIELTTQQMHAISLACEMLARLGIGQARIVLDNCLPLKEHHAIDWEEYHSELWGAPKTEASRLADILKRSSDSLEAISASRAANLDLANSKSDLWSASNSP